MEKAHQASVVNRGTVEKVQKAFKQSDRHRRFLSLDTVLDDKYKIENGKCQIITGHGDLGPHHECSIFWFLPHDGGDDADVTKDGE